MVWKPSPATTTSGTSLICDKVWNVESNKICWFHTHKRPRKWWKLEISAPEFREKCHVTLLKILPPPCVIWWHFLNPPPPIECYVLFEWPQNAFQMKHIKCIYLSISFSLSQLRAFQSNFLISLICQIVLKGFAITIYNHKLG